MITLLWALGVYAQYFVVAFAVSALVLGAVMAYKRIVEAATAAPRCLECAVDPICTEGDDTCGKCERCCQCIPEQNDYDLTQQSHPRGIAPPAPHGLGESPLQHSPIVPLWGFPEPEQRLFEELGIWVRDSRGNGWEVNR